MKKKYSLKLIVALMLIASALTVAITILTINHRRNWGNGEISAAVSEYEALLRKIGESYIGQFEIDEISAEAMRAAVISLGDRWSYYMTPSEYSVFLDRTNNRFAGIGVGVAIDGTLAGMKVLYVYKGSPAEAGGVVAGDMITAIDGGGIAGISIDEMRALLARPIGETVELTVLREDGTAADIFIVYEYVFVEPVSYEMIGYDIGYISIVNFDEGAADGFITAVDALVANGAAAFIFDVRSNNGGRVTELTAILDYLLPEGEIFVAVVKNGDEDVTYSGPEMIDMPAVVLVNDQSYSAAEYFAATLGEYGYAYVVGEHTTGKNRIQRTYELPGGGALHISTGQYLTKNRVSLFDAGGLQPDYEVSLTDEEYTLFVSGRLNMDEDPQLQKAIKLLK